MTRTRTSTLLLGYFGGIGAEWLHYTAGYGRLGGETFDNYIAQASFGLGTCHLKVLS